MKIPSEWCWKHLNKGGRHLLGEEAPAAKQFPQGGRFLSASDSGFHASMIPQGRLSPREKELRDCCFFEMWFTEVFMVNDKTGKTCSWLRNLSELPARRLRKWLSIQSYSFIHTFIHSSDIFEMLILYHSMLAMGWEEDPEINKT